MRRRWLASSVGAVLIAALVPLGLGVRAAGVRSSDPWWFSDSYTTTAYVDLRATTAVIDLGPPGLVRLPYAPAQVAFDPAGTYVLVATEGGVQAYLREGAQVVSAPGWRLGAADATGVAWIDGGAAFAVTTPFEVAEYGLAAIPGAYRAEQVAASPVGRAIGAAPGPSSLPGAVLVATPTGAALWAMQGLSLVSVSGGPQGLAGNRGVASTRDGSIVATWQRGQVELWAWNGSAYVRTPLWDPPTVPGNVVGVAFFARSDGYFVLTDRGRLSAYAFGPLGVTALPGYGGVVTAPEVPVALGAGWSGVSAVALLPSGWTYQDWMPGTGFGPDPAKSLSGQSFAVYQPSAVLQSVPLRLGHAVSEVRIEDADCALGQRLAACTHAAVVPAGTSVAYAVATGACAHWVDVAPFVNGAVAASDQICYRLRLATGNPVRTPVVDVTNIYEVARQTFAGPGSVRALLCLGGGC